MRCPNCDKLFRYKETDYCVWCGKSPADGDYDMPFITDKIEDLQLGIMELLEEDGSKLTYQCKSKLCSIHSALADVTKLYLKAN